jgi:hypothetical protein
MLYASARRAVALPDSSTRRRVTLPKRRPADSGNVVFHTWEDGDIATLSVEYYNDKLGLRVTRYKTLINDPNTRPCQYYLCSPYSPPPIQGPRFSLFISSNLKKLHFFPSSVESISMQNCISINFSFPDIAGDHEESGEKKIEDRNSL